MLMRENHLERTAGWQNAEGLGPYSYQAVLWEEELETCLWSILWIINSLKSIEDLLTCPPLVAVARLIHVVQHNRQP